MGGLPGRVEPQDAEPQIRKVVDDALRVVLQRIGHALDRAIQLRERLESLAVEIFVANLDDAVRVIDEGTGHERMRIATAFVRLIGVVRQRPAHVVISWDQRDLSRRQREPRHQLLEEQPRCVVLGGLGTVDEIPGHHERVQHVDLLLPEIRGELRIRNGHLVFRREVKV
jgi:hypothetical protein